MSCPAVAILHVPSLHFNQFGGIISCASKLHATHLCEDVQCNSFAFTHRTTNMVLQEKHLREKINRKKGVPRIKEKKKVI